ncbi:nesprin-3 isoform 3-T3 [Discoglossus pictus]
MTQLLQNEFETSMETAESWMKDIHEKLKENDNTQGPREALEHRLRETEKICSLEPDGRLLIDIVLSKADALRSESGEEEQHEILTKLRHIKAMFEETTTYMIHCHSRIEWVWLHWNEYLKALGQFTMWIHNMKLTLEPDMELQLGLKEKRWQHDHYQVLLRDVTHHAQLLDRLLEEAASLYNRIGDPSVDETVQSGMMAEYKQIKKKAQERAEIVQKIMKEHEAYDGDVNQFRSWLNSVIEKLKLCVGGTTESTEQQLSLLQEISDDVQNGEKQLEVLEVKSAEVIKNTSPLGADQICTELEELRRALAELKKMNKEEEETLLKTHNSENAFLDLARQLEFNINEFRKAIQRLEESLRSGERVRDEEELIALWRKLNATKSALAAEETKAERVKVQLKDLFKFSKDVQPLSDSVIAAMREYQRAKSKAFKLSTETESALRQHFQNPLREFLLWKPITERVLDSSSAPMSDISMNNDFIQQIEMLLEESCSIKDKLEKLELKRDPICDVFGAEKAESLLKEASVAEQERAALHNDLLQRKNALQIKSSESKDFDAAFELLHRKVAELRKKAAKENEPQPDLVGKETQHQRLQMLLDDLERLEPHIKELSSTAQSSPIANQKASQLTSEYRTLHRSLETNIGKSKQYIEDHRIYNVILLDLQRWIMVKRQELESYQDGSGELKIQAIERDIDILLEKEIQLHQIEGHGQVVMENSSPEGAALVQTEMNQLRASWVSLKELWEKLLSLLKERDLQSSGSQTHKISTTVTIRNSSGIVQERDASTRTSESNMTGGRGNSGILQEMDPKTRTAQSEMSPTGEKRNTGIPQDMGPNSVASQSNRSPTGIRTNTGILQEMDPKTRTAHSEISLTGEKRNTGIFQVMDPNPGTEQFDWRPTEGKRNIGFIQQTDVNSRTSPSEWSKTIVRTNTGIAQEIDLDTRTEQSERNSTGRKINAGLVTLRHNQVVDQNSRTSESERSSTGGKTNPGSLNLSILQEIDSNSRGDQSERSQTEGKNNPGLVTVRTDQNINLLDVTSQYDKTPGGGQLNQRNSPQGKHPQSGKRSDSLKINSSSVTKKNSPKTPKAHLSNNPTPVRKNQKSGSASYSKDVVDSPSAYSMDKRQNDGDHSELLKEFELWLKGENSKLSKICSTEAASDEDFKSRRSWLQKLKARVPQGQRLFESLLLCRPSMAVTEDLRLENLRYQWMLYKSKLRDCGSSSILQTSEEPRGITKNSSGGLCSFVQRVCCAALPLQLLLLSLLLLLLLLPFMLESQNCALANNYARSFNLMLRHERPPPT